MGLFVITHTLEETFQPKLLSRILWPYAYSVELADLRAKHLNRRIILMHDEGKLNKGICVLCHREAFAGVRVQQEIRFIAHCPKFHGMEGSKCIRTCTQPTVRVIHVIYPLACQVGPLLQRWLVRERSRARLARQKSGACLPREIRLYHAIGPCFGEQCAETIELVIREHMLLTPVTARETQQFDTCITYSVINTRTLVHKTGTG